MSQAYTDIDTSVLSEMDFDSVCQTTRYLVNPITKNIIKKLPQCGRKAEYVITYHAIDTCEPCTRLCCERCFMLVKNRDTCAKCGAMKLISYNTIEV